MNSFLKALMWFMRGATIVLALCALAGGWTYLRHGYVYDASGFDHAGSGFIVFRPNDPAAVQLRALGEVIFASLASGICALVLQGYLKKKRVGK
jgi:hypothetical protein